MSITKDFIFASTDFLIALSHLKKKNGKEFQELASVMETFYDQMEAIVSSADNNTNGLRLKNAMLTLERDALGKEIGQLLNEAYKRDKELFQDLLNKFTILPPKRNEPKG
jgi:mannose-6-phosphate isomerase class I